jgi:autotransporter-associated beta strand protein
VTLANAATLNGNLTLLGSNALTLNGVIRHRRPDQERFGQPDPRWQQRLPRAGGAECGRPDSGVEQRAGFGDPERGERHHPGCQRRRHGRQRDQPGGQPGIVGSNDLTLSGAINGAGSLTKNGAANLTLSGANNFLGGVTLNAGTLTAGSNGASVWAT